MPTGPPDEAAASTPGVRLAMVMVNVWQAGGATPLVPHTVVGPKVPAMVGVPVMKPVDARDSPGGSAPLVTENVAAGVSGLVANWWT